LALPRELTRRVGMSTQAAVDFLEKASSDAAIAELIRGSSKEEKMASAVSAGREFGYEFTVEEIQGIIQSNSGELDESELDLVSGGGIRQVAGSAWKWMMQTFGGNGGDNGGGNDALGIRG